MKTTIGLTLLEVLVAIVVLAIGVLMAASMQVSGLRASNDATVIQMVTKIAEGEIVYRRQVSVMSSPGNLATCQAVLPLPTGYSCGVAIRPCQLLAATPTVAGAMSCPTGAPALTEAHQITVTVSGPRNKTATLRTVKAVPQ